MQPFFWAIRCGGDFGSGSGSKFNCAGRDGLGQTILGTDRVRASVLSPCRPLLWCHLLFGVRARSCQTLAAC